MQYYFFRYKSTILLVSLSDNLVTLDPNRPRQQFNYGNGYQKPFKIR